MVTSRWISCIGNNIIIENHFGSIPISPCSFQLSIRFIPLTIFIQGLIASHTRKCIKFIHITLHIRIMSSQLLSNFAIENRIEIWIVNFNGKFIVSISIDINISISPLRFFTTLQRKVRFKLPTCIYIKMLRSIINKRKCIRIINNNLLRFINLSSHCSNKSNFVNRIITNIKLICWSPKPTLCRCLRCQTQQHKNGAESSQCLRLP